MPKCVKNSHCGNRKVIWVAYHTVIAVGFRASMWTKKPVQSPFPHAESNFALDLKSPGMIPSSTEGQETRVLAPCVPELVRRNATISPTSLALRAGSDRLTYHELECRSNKLAQYLNGLGVKPGSIVGLYLKRSVEFAVAALAILKTGSAYLPIDIATPGDRLRMMLAGAQASTIVTQSALSGMVSREIQQLVALDSRSEAIRRCSAEALPVRIAPEDLAYVIYTSGSTGAPRAVAIGHGSLLNLVAWHNRAFGITRADVATQSASTGFDASVWELWPHLAAGACVHVVDEAVRVEPEKFRDWLVREKITISFVPTPLVERMIKLPWPAQTSLRFLLTGADTLHHYPAVGLPFQLVNNYGPTECTVVATSGIVAPQENQVSLPPIGRAIDHTEIYILDHNKKQVPTGQLGEIYIGGAGLARGYLNDPELTAQRFVQHPFREVADARLYRTGDLGCLLPDGQIAFHGRADDQVKIRGHRIELNEISCALSRHPAVRENVVVAGEDAQGEKRLVAYVVPEASSLNVSELRDFLAREMPNYMIPATFVGLDAIPVGSTGKVNRSALPAPNDENLLRDEAFVGARTPTEQGVTEIILSLLSLKSMSVNDNFFYLGGDSLFGIQVIARLSESFHVELPLLCLFDYPTVAELAAEVERLVRARIEAMSEEEAPRLLAQNSEQPGL
jgi:amino acid adenylation domain-containing protein